MLELAVLASNNGSSMRAIVRAIETGRLDARIRLIVSNKPQCGALDFGRDHHLPVRVIPTLPDADRADQTLCAALVAADAQIVILSGYLRKLGPVTLDRFAGRILNVHPALLPKFGGRGMYGRRVHEAVLASGDHETGASVHLVDGDYDHGAVIAVERVALRSSDTVADVERKVMAAEEELFVSTLLRIAQGELTLPAFVPLDLRQPP